MSKLITQLTKLAAITSSQPWTPPTLQETMPAVCLITSKSMLDWGLSNTSRSLPINGQQQWNRMREPRKRLRWHRPGVQLCHLTCSTSNFNLVQKFSDKGGHELMKVNKEHTHTHTQKKKVFNISHTPFLPIWILIWHQTCPHYK